MNYELRITNYELWIMNYELRITNYELRINIRRLVPNIDKTFDLNAIFLSREAGKFGSHGAPALP